MSRMRRVEIAASRHGLRPRGPRNAVGSLKAGEILRVCTTGAPCRWTRIDAVRN